MNGRSEHAEPVTSGLIDVGTRRRCHEGRGGGPALLLITGGTDDDAGWVHLVPTLVER